MVAAYAHGTFGTITPGETPLPLLLRSLLAAAPPPCRGCQLTSPPPLQAPTRW